MFEWIWLNWLSPLLLPVFVIMILSTVAGARPEGVLKMLLDFTIEIVSLLFRLILQIVDSVSRLFFGKPGNQPRLPRPKLPPRRLAEPEKDDDSD